MEDRKLSKEELLSLVRKIYKDEFNTEEESDNAMQLFLSSVPDPEALNLFRQFPYLTPEEIVEKALAYKPILL